MSYLRVTYTSFNRQPWITSVVYWDLLNLCWEMYLFCFQITMNVLFGITTNEFVNRKKYDYLRPGPNPFNLGPFKNLLNLWTPYGPHSSLDYTTLYSAPLTTTQPKKTT